MNPQRDDGIAGILREREARSLMQMLGIGLSCFVAWAIYMAVVQLVRSQAHVDVTQALIYFALSIGVLVAMLALLRRRLWIDTVGIIAALGCGTFAATTGYVMWRVYASDAPAAMLTKIPMAATGITMIAFMTLTLRPLYVVIVGCGVATTLLGFFSLAALDPNTVFASNSAEPYMGPAVSSTRLIVELLCVAGTTSSAATAVFYARRTVGEAVMLQRTTDQLSRYFSPEVATGIRTGGDAFLQPGGREQEIAVLFSDLQGFTRICAGLPASEALAMLCAYHERMVAEIFGAGGTLDKFMGDGIMATFGTPTAAGDAADRAVRAARGMVTALADLNRERVERGQEALVQRIGIHAGPALVGNVGTRQRLEFTVVGDTVNVASRIEVACKRTGKAVMMSAEVVDRLRTPVALESIGPVLLDGQSKPIELYALA